MKASATYIIGGIFIAYLIFVAVVMFIYEPLPEDRAWEDRQAYNSQKITEISFGQSLEAIKKIFGRADFVEAKTATDGQYQLLFYRTHHITSDGITTRDECTPLLFKNNVLIAWGLETYQQYLDSKILLEASQPALEH
ncbi:MULTISPECIES: DUF3192 domain-containing protein [Shewanella]|uniref:DUF3192 domain-containing protein n=1 Tax=Shewanella holmiensis TaxID=2952222 RepID=A0A9X2WLX8_9GAMM|nr:MULTISPECIES: DUF3192 domain-containing protein [Shewanella]MCT7941575.1 DUF3192 domain-containing protein [Shewanella holmiensis]MDP5144905.1 DUF3192 domain-containing protein [Shewanella sp. ULN5]